MSKKVLFLVPYPTNTSPSQRFRFELFYSILREAKISFRTISFLEGGDSLSVGDIKLSKSVFIIIRGFWNRVLTLFKVRGFDFVFIHREATPVGPPWVEWAIRFIFRKQIIYDFDDAIWTTDRIEEPALVRVLKWRGKVASICKWSYKISAGNDYLLKFASSFNKNLHLVPTVVDTVATHFPGQQRESSSVTIGWTGSSSTLKYLYEIVPVLQSIQLKYSNVNFLIIADKNPNLPLQRVTFLKWNEKTEVADLVKIDIGIMPLPDDEWSRGKCGFKAIQYMALEIPAVVSNVGVNNIIVDSGTNGWVANDENEWITSLSNLIEDKSLRRTMGVKAREKIIKNYSVTSNCSAFLRLFE